MTYLYRTGRKVRMSTIPWLLNDGEPFTASWLLSAGTELDSNSGLASPPKMKVNGFRF